MRADADEVARRRARASPGSQTTLSLAVWAAPHSIDDAPRELALAGERLGRRREPEARDLGDDPAALLALPLGRVLFLELGEVRLHLLLHAGDPAGPGLGDRRRGLLRGEDRQVGECLRAAVVVEVGVGDERAARPGRRAPAAAAQVARRPGREAAVDDEGPAAEVGDARVADAGAGRRARRLPRRAV